MISISINLSKDIYSGGVLQIFDCKSKKIIHEVGNTGFGDAIIFRITPNLEHMVTDVEGEVSKVAFAGWFQTEPDFHSMVNERFSKLINQVPEVKKTKITISDDCFIQRASGFFSHNLAEETIVFNPTTTSYHTLNRMGSKIWDLIQASTTLSEIQNAIFNEFDVEQEQCEQDISILLQEMLSAKLITPVKKKDLIDPLSLTISGISK